MTTNIGMFDKIKPQEGNLHIGVTGVTVIDHRTRRKLGLSCDEYVMMQFIDQNADKKNNYKIDKELIWKFTGFTFEEAVLLIQKLSFKSLISLTGNSYQITNYWRSLNPKEDDVFEEIWIIMKKKGNKIKSLKSWKACIKLDPATDILQKTKDYVVHHNKLGTPLQYRMKVENWLDAGTKPYNDIIHEDEQQQTNTPAVRKGKIG